MGMGRITIGLYNSLNPKQFQEPHRRAVARAGGLAMSFNMNLALIGFPFPEDLRTPVELANWIAGTTSIGQHGGYFVDLAERGRFHSFPYPTKGFPPQLGEPILTTSKPDPKKSMTVRQLADMVRRGQSVLLVFGLGPHGVPKDAAAIPKYNVDVTGGGYSLETCTAVGSVTGALHALLYE